MAQVIIRPNVNVQTQWPNEVGGVRPAIVADAIDANLVGNGGQAGALTDWFECDDLPGNAGAITNVVQWSRAKRLAGQLGAWGHGCRVGVGTETWTSYVTGDYPQGVWTNKSTNHATDPDGGAWTVEKINNIQIGYRQTSGVATKSSQYTDLWYVIDYELVVPYVREGTITKLRNPTGSGGLLLPKAHATIAFEFIPEWDHDENTGTKYLFRLEHDANNYIELHWDGTDLVARFRYNAVNQNSSLAPTWNAGDTLKLGVRWLDDGELGKENAQGQLFAKIGSGAWQEAVPVEFSAELQEVAESIFYIGSKGGTIDEHNAADGLIRYLHCFPEALPFEEIQALLGEPA